MEKQITFGQWGTLAHVVLALKSFTISATMRYAIIDGAPPLWFVGFFVCGLPARTCILKNIRDLHCVTLACLQGDDRWLEIWNVVLMSNELSADGSVSELPVKCIDTGTSCVRV